MYFKKGWFGPNLKSVRKPLEDDQYNYYRFEDLPKINRELDDNFTWLDQAIYSNKLRNPELARFGNREPSIGDDLSNKLNPLEKELKEYGLSLPISVKRFLKSPEINKRFKSPTDDYFDVADFIEVLELDATYYLFHFMSDSQYCMLWYLCFNEFGNHFVIASPKLYGHKIGNKDDEELKNDPYIGYIVQIISKNSCIDIT